MESDWWHVRNTAQLLEDAGEPVRRHRIADEAGEDVAAVLIGLSRRHAFGFLPGAVLAQRGDRGAIQGDHPSAMPGLRAAADDTAVVLLLLLTDHRSATIEIKVTPARPGRLPAPQPTRRDQVVSGVQAMITDLVQEHSRLRRRPRRHHRPLTRTPPMLPPVTRPHPCTRPTVISRSSRLVHLPRIEGWGEKPPVKNGPSLGGYGAVAMNTALTASMTKLPEQLRKTLTWDRGKELFGHV